MNSGVLLGVIIGIVVFVVVKTGCIIYLWRRNSRRSKSRILSSTASTASVANTAELLAYLEKWEIRCDDVRLVRRQDGSDWELGAGAFGRVVKGLRAGVQEVAVKMLFQSDHKAQEAFLREISMLKFASRDRNVVQFYGVSIQNNGIWLITEHMEGGDLRNALTMDGPERVTWWNKGKQVACDVARGLAFLHSNKIIHRDLKSKNVLLSKDGTAKITDVGMAKLMSEAYFTQDASFGTFSWAAPEVLLGEKCSEKVDCYSLGGTPLWQDRSHAPFPPFHACHLAFVLDHRPDSSLRRQIAAPTVTCWELATGLMPVRGQMAPPSEEECPCAVRQLIADLMRRDPRTRPSAAEAYRRLKACEPNPEVVLEPEDLADEPQQGSGLSTIKERNSGALTWNSTARHDDSACDPKMQTGPVTLLELAEGASHRVTMMENSFMHLPVPGRESCAPREAEAALLLQLAQGASTKLNAIDSDKLLAACESDPIKQQRPRPARGLSLSPEQLSALAMEEGLLREEAVPGICTAETQPKLQHVVVQQVDDDDT